MKEIRENRFPEIGYTPYNLRHLIKLTHLSQEKFAERFDIKFRTLQSYLSHFDVKTHRDMGSKQWEELIQKVIEYYKIN